MRLEPSAIEPKFGKGGTNEDGRLIPRSVTSFCPNCNVKASFSVSKVYNQKHKSHCVTTSSCPDCEQVVQFFLFYSQNALSPEPTSVMMFPSPDFALAKIETPDELPTQIKAAIRDAEDAFRAGLFSPALTSAGRALEGLLKYLAKSEGRSNLNKLVDDFCGSEAATEPINKLSHAIRNGRNVGAHFDELVTPNAEAAQLIIELLQSFIAYFFVFDQKATRLEEVIDPRRSG